MAFDLEKLKASLEKQAKGGSSGATVDPRFYKQRWNNDGVASAIIRFIPPKNEDDDPIVGVFRHQFNGPNGGFYKENCPTTIGQDCPVCKANGVVYKTLTEAEKKNFKRSRKHKFYVNALVLVDVVTPENNGKVFLVEIDNKMFKKIMAKVSPPEAEVAAGVASPCNVFDFATGANFRYGGSVATQEGDKGKYQYINYDNSSFDAPSALPANLIEIAKRDAFDLTGFIAPDQFKSYDDLEKRFNQVMGNTVTSEAVADAVAADPITNAFGAPTTTTTTAVVEDDDDSDDEFLRKLQ